MPKNYILHAEPGEYRIQGGEVNFSIERVHDAVEVESRIPPDAKMAVKEFIIKTLQRVSESASEVLVNIPKELAQYAEVIEALIKAIIGG